MSEITTPEELEALPVGTPLWCSDGRIRETMVSNGRPALRGFDGGHEVILSRIRALLPAVVLHRPDAPATSAEDRAAIDVIREHAYSSRGFFCYDNREGRNGARCWWTPDPEQGDDYRDQHAQHLAAVLAARQPAPVDAETTTEWGIRHADDDSVETCDDGGDPYDEETAVEELETYDPATVTLVAREATPWREARRG